MNYEDNFVRPYILKLHAESAILFLALFCLPDHQLEEAMRFVQILKRPHSFD